MSSRPGSAAPEAGKRMGNRDRKLSPKVQKKPSSKQKNSICQCVALVLTRCTGIIMTNKYVFGHKPFCTLEIN